MPHQEADLSFLDRPEILEIVFPIAYSPFYRAEYASSPPGLPLYPVEVDKGINIDCAFWSIGKDKPTILYFHGNGETVPAHQWIAPLYSQRGINLFVADYRGYGSSGGMPTITNMLGDSAKIFQAFERIIKEQSFRPDLFVMGRSLGSIPAIEVAVRYQERIRGLIIESGTANNFRSLYRYAGIEESEDTLGDDAPFLNKVKIRQVREPTLIIHGELDEIIPVREGRELHENSGAQEKQLLIIPGLGHNDLMAAQDLYFRTVEEFVKVHSQK